MTHARRAELRTNCNLVTAKLIIEVQGLEQFDQGILKRPDEKRPLPAHHAYHHARQYSAIARDAMIDCEGSARQNSHNTRHTARSVGEQHPGALPLEAAKVMQCFAGREATPEQGLEDLDVGDHGLLLCFCCQHLQDRRRACHISSATSDQLQLPGRPMISKASKDPVSSCRWSSIVSKRSYQDLSSADLSCSQKQP